MTVLLTAVVLFLVFLGVRSGYVAYREGRFAEWVCDVLLISYISEIFD